MNGLMGLGNASRGQGQAAKLVPAAGSLHATIARGPAGRRCAVAVPRRNFESDFDGAAAHVDMMFSFDDEELRAPAAPQHSLPLAELERRAKLAWHLNPVERKLLWSVVSIKQVVGERCEQDEATFAVALWLAACGYQGVRIRRATGSSEPGRCLRQLRHTFVVLDSPKGGELVCDVHFRDQFVLACATPAYRAFLYRAVPGVFVGSPGQLLEVLRAVDAAIQDTCHHQAVPVPPWRELQPLLSKWQPQQFTDYPVTAQLLHCNGSLLRRLSDHPAWRTYLEDAGSGRRGRAKLHGSCCTARPALPASPPAASLKLRRTVSWGAGTTAAAAAAHEFGHAGRHAKCGARGAYMECGARGAAGGSSKLLARALSPAPSLPFAPAASRLRTQAGGTDSHPGQPWAGPGARQAHTAAGADAPGACAAAPRSHSRQSGGAAPRLPVGAAAAAGEAGTGPVHCSVGFVQQLQGV